MKVFLPAIGKVSDHHPEGLVPEKTQDRPADDDIKAALAEIADHPEITLSRREILRFILVEPTKRSEEIQTILKLDEIGETRGAFNTAQNKLQTAYQRHGASEVQPGRLQLHLQISTMHAAELLEAVNNRRKLLGSAGNRGANRGYKTRCGAVNGSERQPSSTSSRPSVISGALTDAAEGILRVSQKQRRPRSSVISRNWRRTRPFSPPCSGAPSSKKVLISWTAPRAPSAIRRGRTSSTCATT